jgi:hypothetical protein
MTVESKWKNEYQILKNYIVSNPEISIGMYEISIPEEFKDRFYTLFDDVRRAVVESWLSSFDFDVNTLSKSFVETENKLSKNLGLKHIDLPVELASFIHDPKEGMMRLIYDRMFELVQGKISEDDFEEMSRDDLAASAAEMFRYGYETWTLVSVLNLLEPDEIFGVTFRNDFHEDAEPSVSELDQIVIGKQAHHPSKRIPEFIIHSKKLDSHIAFKLPPENAVDSYYLPVEVPTKRILRDRTGDTSTVLSNRVLFISVVEDLNKLPVFADLHKRTVSGPDITIEFLTGHDFQDSRVLNRVHNRLETLKPRLGANIVLFYNNLDSVPAKTETGIDIFPVGLDQSKLQPILDKLA